MTDQPLAVELTDITKTFPGVIANEDVNLAVGAGEIHAILGENGAGKSTLMKILFGQYQPVEGQIFLAGKPVNFKSPLDAISLPGGGALFTTPTVDEVYTIANTPDTTAPIVAVNPIHAHDSRPAIASSTIRSQSIEHQFDILSHPFVRMVVWIWRRSSSESLRCR